MHENVLVPMPLPIHIIFCVIGMLYCGFRYYQKNYPYFLLLTIAIPSTLLIYISQEKWFFIALAIEEVALGLLIIINLISVSKKTALAEADANTPSSPSEAIENPSENEDNSQK